MLMLATTTVTQTLSHAQKIVHALKTVQMDAHAVMMKLIVPTGKDFSRSQK